MEKSSRRPDVGANRLNVFGDSMMNKLPRRSRKKRKRQASKRRRTVLRKSLAGEQAE